MDKDLLQESYAQIYDLLGEEAMQKVFELYRGRQISFPMRLYDRNKVMHRILKEYNGHNISELTHKYNYSQRWIRQVINKEKGKSDAK
ncbi:hypothetical protein IV38_GL001680 [Lactobacillus selangorensis]|uniref:Mor transcription activator domain-containing protein n=1 Tax=Lactobacillus selangorensis TaxID=81857 RepID=A0A0R2FQX0_9LACO|nr:Mor transcription activator family protein [Lactobacillus selangorensis]KRN28226.1 hypothetical protein IV38_GL001680 [Lactobacillus selangorensis]KRN30898.1 hypothetical protein IV40_GL001535 [Lactobacillus selangorensis]